MEFFDIEGYPRYSVSLDGRIFSNNYRNTGKRKPLKLSKNSEGYLQVNLFNPNGEGKTHLVHRLVFSSITGCLLGDGVIDHVDGNPSNNRFSNLQNISQAENIQKAKRPSSRNYRREYVKMDNELRPLRVYNYQQLVTEGFTPQLVRRCCLVKRYSHKGYYWKFKEEE